MRNNTPEWVIPPVERFWPKVLKTETCWLWQAQKNNRGYGCFYPLHGRLCYAHRFAWATVNGPIPEGLSVLHKCDTPACVNPDHLFVGTQTDNMRDCAAKGRRPNNAGLNHPRHKLREETILAIRADTRTHRAIAAHYGISYGHVGAIKIRRTWKCLP